MVALHLRTDLPEPQVRLLTRAVFSILNSVATLNKGLGQDEIVATMSTAALQALTCLSRTDGPTKWKAGLYKQ